MRWVIINHRPDYDCDEYFCYWGSDAWRRPVWGNYKSQAATYETKREAERAMRELNKHRKKWPSCWHQPRAAGGYGLDRMRVERR